MNTETKKQLKKFTDGWQEAAEQKAKSSTGWAKVWWIIACVACAVAGYFLNSCTMTQARQAAELHNIYHYVTDTECQLARPDLWVVEPEESQK